MTRVDGTRLAGPGCVSSLDLLTQMEGQSQTVARWAGAAPSYDSRQGFMSAAWRFGVGGGRRRAALRRRKLYPVLAAAPGRVCVCVRRLVPSARWPRTASSRRSPRARGGLAVQRGACCALGTEAEPSAKPLQKQVL